MQYREQAHEFQVYDESAVRRMAFLQKVYLTFLFSLIAASIGAYVGLQPKVLRAVAGNYLLFFIVELVALFAAIGLRKQPGINLLALFAFTFASGITLSPMLAVYLALGKAAIIKEALSLTCVVFLGLTVYVFVTKKDFSFLGGFLFMGLFGLLGMGVMFIFFPPSSTSYMVYSGIGALIFCGYILYDTSVLLHNWESNDYVGFAISLYLDFLNLFIYLLQLLAAKDRH
jgi:modulator of FtsH protease